MNRAHRTLVLCSLALAMLGGTTASAFAPPGAGNSAAAPGQARAQSQCQNVINRQTGMQPGHGSKSAGTRPTNCDHVYNP